MLSLRWDNLIVSWAQTSLLMLAYIVKTTFKISKILFPQQSQIRDKTLKNTPWALVGNPFLFIKSYKALPFFLLSLWIMFFNKHSGKPQILLKAGFQKLNNFKSWQHPVLSVSNSIFTLWVVTYSSASLTDPHHTQQCLIPGLCSWDQESTS